MKQHLRKYGLIIFSLALLVADIIATHYHNVTAALVILFIALMFIGIIVNRYFL